MIGVSIKSVKTDLEVVGMIKISAWLQEMLGVLPQIRRPWLEINFRNWNKPGALSRCHPLQNDYKEVELVQLKSRDGTAYHKVYMDCLSQLTQHDQNNLTFKHETTLDNTWKEIHYDADIYHQINVKNWLVEIMTVPMRVKMLMYYVT